MSILIGQEVYVLLTFHIELIYTVVQI